jgi:hypothetical protein
MRFLGPADVEQEPAAVVGLSKPYPDACVTLRMARVGKYQRRAIQLHAFVRIEAAPWRQPQRRGRSPAAFMTELLGQGLGGRRLPSQRRLVTADASIHRVRTEVRAIRGAAPDEL